MRGVHSISCCPPRLIADKENTMQLWSGTLSPFSAKVRIVLAEKGLPYIRCRRHRYAHDGEFFFIPGLRALAGDAPTALDDDDECKAQRGL